MSEFMKMLEDSKMKIQTELNKLPEDVRLKIEQDTNFIVEMNKNINLVKQTINDKSTSTK